MKFLLFIRCCSTAHYFGTQIRSLRLDPLDHRLRALDKPYHTAIFPVDERIGMLAEIPEDQVAFAD